MNRMLILLTVLFFSGCASSEMYLPKHAISDPAEGVSIPSVQELEKSGVKYITTFTAPMSDDLFVELVNGGGVYPALARQPNGEIVKGYAYFAGSNYWCDFLLKFVFAGKEKLDEKAKILAFNRDAGFAYTITGIEVSRIVSKEGKPISYDPKKFDDDETYRKQFFERVGQTTEDVDKLWKLYFKAKGATESDLNEISSVQVVKIGTPEWQEFTDKTASQMPHRYNVGDEVRSGHLPLEEFRQVAIENPGFNGGQRFMRTAAIPIFALPFIGATLPIMAGVSVVSSAVNASINTDWSGYYARAKTLRIALAPTFAQALNMCRIQIYKRDKLIEKLLNQ